MNCLQNLTLVRMYAFSSKVPMIQSIFWDIFRDFFSIILATKVTESNKYLYHQVVSVYGPDRFSSSCTRCARILSYLSFWMFIRFIEIACNKYVIFFHDDFFYNSYFISKQFRLGKSQTTIGKLMPFRHKNPKNYKACESCEVFIIRIFFPVGVRKSSIQETLQLRQTKSNQILVWRNGLLFTFIQ